jgi:hypothetical protein
MSNLIGYGGICVFENRRCCTAEALILRIEFAKTLACLEYGAAGAKVRLFFGWFVGLVCSLFCALRDICLMFDVSIHGFDSFSSSSWPLRMTRRRTTDDMD